MAHILVETPGGKIYVEVEDSDEIARTGNSSSTAAKTFTESVEAFKKNAYHIIDALKEIAPTEIEVTFGIKAAAEAGTPIFALAKASGEASYSVTVKWDWTKKAEEEVKNKPISTKPASPK